MDKEGLGSHSGKVVLTAVAINLTNTLAKLVAWLISGESFEALTWINYTELKHNLNINSNTLWEI